MNSFSVRLVNRTDEVKTMSLSIAPVDTVEGVADEDFDKDVELSVVDQSFLELEPRASVLVPVSVAFDKQMTVGDGNEAVHVIVQDDQQQRRQVLVRLLGPR